MSIIVCDACAINVLLMTPGVVRMTIIGDDTTWCVAHNHHSDDSRGVIYDHNNFTVQTTGI